MKTPILHLAGSITGAPSTSAARYSALAGGASTTTWLGGNPETPFPVAGNMTKWRVRIPTAPGSGKSWTFELMINGVAHSTFKIVLTNTDTEGTVTGSVAIAAQDLVSIRLTPSGTPTAFTDAVKSALLFEGTASGDSVIFGGSDSNVTLSNSAASYLPPGAIEAQLVANRLRAMGVVSTPGTLDKLIVYATAAVATGSYVFELYHSTAASNGAAWTATGVTVTLTSSGRLAIDSTHSYAVARGDLIQLVATPSSTPTAIAIKWACRFVPTTVGESMLFSLMTDQVNNDTSNTFENANGMASRTAAATESNAYNILPIAAEAKNLVVRVTTSPSTGRLSTLRVNGSDSALTCTISNPAVAASDTTHSVSLADNDSINFRTAGTSGFPTAPGQMQWGLTLYIAGAQTVAVGQASETDTALTATKLRTKSVGQASETDTGLAATKRKSKTVGLASETDTAFTATHKRTKIVGLATETDTAFNVSSGAPVPVGQALETDTAFAATKRRTKAVGLASEADTAFSATKRKTRAVGLASETDTAFILSKRKTRAVGQASETDTAFAATIEGGLTVITLAYIAANADKIVVCSALPTTFEQADTPYDERVEETEGYKLGEKSFTAGTIFEEVSLDDTYAKTAEFIDGLIVANGAATHWAILDTATSQLLAAGALPDGLVTVTEGNDFAMTPITVIADLSAEADAFEHPNDPEIAAKIRVPLTVRRLYDTKCTTLCRCWTLTRTDGTVFGFTDHDNDLTIKVDGEDVLCEASSGLTASAIDRQSNLATDTADLFGALISDRLSEDLLAAGLFDNAQLEMWIVNWKNTRQRSLFVSGSIGEVSRGRTAFKAELRTRAHYLNQDRGRVYSKLCDADLGDERCGVDLDDPAFKGTGYVETVVGDGVFRVTGIDAFEDQWFSDGLLTMTSGQNTAINKEVRNHTVLPGGDVEIELLEPLPFTLVPGDAFIITAGCDKTPEMCQEKFDNLVNHRGFMFIPGNDIIARTASKDDQNDGSSLF